MPMLKNAAFFKVVEDVENDAGGFKAIRSSKNVLAFTSPVFKQQFFGSLSANKNSGDSTQDKMEIVNIQGLTFSIFKDFIELIISSDANIIDTAEDFEYLFEMLRIADKYQVLDIVDLVKGRIATVEMTLANVVKAASIAENYQDLLNFEVVSRGVLKRCAAVLVEYCPTSVDLSNFILDNKDQEELVFRLIKKEFWNIFKCSCHENLFAIRDLFIDQ